MACVDDSVRMPTGTGQRGIAYYGGLDGLRALAIAAVLVYHGGVGWAGGGFLGVESFFVLSGFLITSLLIAECRRTSTIALRAFWARRARRLLPALFCLVGAVGLHQIVTGPANAVPGLEQDGIATLFYYGNWHQIATQSNYFAATGPVSPLQHTWSLAIEEQFYIMWPLLFGGILWLAVRALRRPPRRPERGLRLLLGVTVAGLLASAIDVILRFDGGRGLNRVYYGTDTRALSILTGASLALAAAVFWPTAGLGRPLSPGHGRLLGAAAVSALAAVLALMHFAGGATAWLYPYGFLGLDLAVAVMIAAVVFAPSSIVGRLFAVRPLRWIGMISYGLYLWHFPLFLWLDADTTGLRGSALLGLRITATLLVALVSFFLIEQPVRQRRLPVWLVRGLTPVSIAAALAVLAFASAAATPPGVAATPPKQTARLTGSASACDQRLADTANYGLAPMSPAKAAVTQPRWLAARRLKWSSSTRLTYHTCPPKRVLLIGDSLAFSIGLAAMINEQHYGVEMANAAILGCSFGVRGEINAGGQWQEQRPGCPTALRRWAQDARAFHPQVVLIELGYRDEFNWRWNGRMVHLGQPEFDRYLQRQMEAYVTALTRGGTKVAFLTVPWSHPPALADGSAAPYGSAARHRQINAMLRGIVARHPQTVRLLDVDSVVSSGNRYRSSVNGKLCRFDGIHFTIYCGQLLQPLLLGGARSMIGS